MLLCNYCIGAFFIMKINRIYTSSYLKSLLLALLMLCSTATIYAQQYDFNENCSNAYNLIVSLRMKEATVIINAEKKLHPNNPIIAYLEHSRDFMVYFVEEKRPDYDILIAKFDERLTTISKGDVKSEWHKYLQAQMNLEAAVARAKVGNFLMAYFEVRRAYTALNENVKLFPNFSPNKKGLGLIHCLMGTVPEKYKWGVEFLGFEADLKKGMNELKEVKTYVDKTDFYCQQELNFVYVYGLLYMLNDKKEAWVVSQQLLHQFPNNLLYYFIGANVAMSNGHNDEALKILNKRPTTPNYLKFGYLDYLTGMCLLRKLDASGAKYFEKFSKEDDRTNFVKDGYQKLAWCYLINKNEVAYSETMNKCLTKGNRNVDADKQAYREATAKEIPNIVLLRARLLCDGGYYEKALHELAGKKMNDFVSKKDQVEFVYRVGRIYDEWGQSDKAIGYYLAAIKYGKELPQHYACNAAYQLGLIYENKKTYDQAKQYYNMCINNFQDADFRNGIEQRARTGLERIKKIK
jgi:tetratricopeptide (TPR) repeat protein